MDKIFVFLCNCLNIIGKTLRWDYYKASVYICIYLWPLLCVAMSLLMVGFAVVNGNPCWITACVIYALLNIFGYWTVVRHYSGDIMDVFSRCRSDLESIAREWHTTYAVVNLVIYLLLFAAIMTFDVSLILLMT